MLRQVATVRTVSMCNCLGLKSGINAVGVVDLEGAVVISKRLTYTFAYTSILRMRTLL